MASRTFAALQGGGRSTLDVPVAALAGLSVAVVAFAMPGDLLADLVGATGLPSFIAAAEPPLGFKARIGIGAAGAVLTFGFIFLLLRWLDKFGGRRAVRKDEEEELILEVEAPRLRRRDIHPDAPARPPLLAAHELGEPDLDEPTLDPYAAWPAPAAEAPVQSIPWPAPASEHAPVADRDYRDGVGNAPIESPEEIDQADAFALSQQRWTDTYEPEPVPEPEPVAEQPWNEPASIPEIEAAEAPEQPQPLAPPIEPEPEQRIAAASPWSPTEVAADEPDQAVERPQPGSIADLMERLEQGLARRRAVPESPAAATTEAPASAVPPADNDRLQNAIDSLQRFASRQD